jgi:hypothetical protein
MDHWNIEAYEQEARTPILQIIKNQLVRSDVIIKYTLIDEFLTDIICNFYFRRKKSGQSYRDLWKTKRFKIFVHYLMDETYLVKKLAIVRASKTVPGEVSSAIMRINDARNALAHSFFPENRRQYAADKKVMYKKAHLFTKEGVEAFNNDYHIASDYLINRAFGTRSV